MNKAIDSEMARILKHQSILNEIDMIDGQLSPENLNCDGEITREQAQLKANKLWARRAKLESEIGRKVEYKG